MPETIKCTRCGTINRSTQYFCSKCSLNLHLTSQVVRRQYIPMTKLQRIFVAAVLGIPGSIVCLSLAEVPWSDWVFVPGGFLVKQLSAAGLDSAMLILPAFYGTNALVLSAAIYAIIWVVEGVAKHWVGRSRGAPAKPEP